MVVGGEVRFAPNGRSIARLISYLVRSCYDSFIHKPPSRYCGWGLLYHFHGEVNLAGPGCQLHYADVIRGGETDSDMVPGGAEDIGRRDIHRFA